MTPRGDVGDIAGDPTHPVPPAQWVGLHMDPDAQRMFSHGGVEVVQ